MLRPIFFTFSLALMMQAHSYGPDPRYTAAPGDSPAACTACHSGTALNGGAGGVKILLPNGLNYTPGVTQHIMVQVADPDQRRWGFQLSARLNSNPAQGQAGDLNPSDANTQVICDSGAKKPCASATEVQFIEHTTAGTRNGTPNGATFEFDWNPPQTNVGNITLYVAGNAANGNGALTGDHIYTNKVELTPATTSTPTFTRIATKYLVHNLVSDIPGIADQTDPNLTNPWGIAISASSAFWISNNHSGTATLYNSTGTPFPASGPLVVKVPHGSVTGQVFNGTGAFALQPGKPAAFLFATEDGVISGWSSSVDPANAVQMIDNSGAGAVYKGLAIAVSSAGPTLYAANFASGQIDVFDGNYQPMTVPGGFQDSNLPAGFAPFNVQVFGTRLFVTYAKQNSSKSDDVAGPGNGYVDRFDLDGNLQQRVISGGVLNSPWGIAIAPQFFGDYSYALLVSNFGDGTINAFDPATGALLGTLQDGNGNALTIPGLWGLQVGNGKNGGDANILYFTAGIPGDGKVEDHGLLGSIAVTQ